MIFIDTSAIYALADRQDPHHRTAVERFTKLMASGEGVLTHNYVVLECLTLLQARLGAPTALKFAKESVAFELEWVDEALHHSGMRELAASPKRRLSFVDQISFLVMKRRSLTTAFAFDPDFKMAGFCLYEPS